MAFVEFKRDGKRAERFELDAAETIIGRDDNVGIQLLNQFVSTRHARIVKTRDAFEIEDLGSANGTFVNGEKVTSRVALHDSDVIKITTCEIIFRQSNGEVPAVAPRRELAKPTEKGSAVKSPLPRSDSELLLRTKIHELTIERMNLKRLSGDTGDDELRRITEERLDEVLQDLDAEIPPSIDRLALKKDLINDILGLGPVEVFLEDESITEIMVNSWNQIYVESAGKLHLSDRRFIDNDHVMRVIQRIVAPIGRAINEASPLVDARLRDGSRVNAVIPPLALKGPTLTIRKFSRKRLVAEDLIGFGSINRAMVEFLEVAVRQRRNIVISGGTGSGKTTLLNILSNFIPTDERIVTVEDAAELQLNQDHVVSLESRPPNMEGKGAITIRRLVKNCLRMRPDRIVVGECRGGEALDMLQAMNTGHDGSLTTAHANSPRDVLSRLETMVLMSGMELPVKAIREQIASAVDVIVQQSRMPDGSRKITYITEVTGMEGDIVLTQDIFSFEQKGFDSEGRVVGQFRAHGIVPNFVQELRDRGIEVNLDMFEDRSKGEY